MDFDVANHGVHVIVRTGFVFPALQVNQKWLAQLRRDNAYEDRFLYQDGG